MELIIRVTGVCDFACTFCSASDIDVQHPVNGVPEQIKDVIKATNPTNIIISGGEPLLVGPEYYEELHDVSNAYISITSNMKDFYHNPNKWKRLFNSDYIGLMTSFNYGNTRMWDKHTVYTEDMFREVTDIYKSVTNGKQLPFIAVLDHDNEYMGMHHIHLAKELGTFVKINNALEHGRQELTYPRYKLFQLYFQILDQGLGMYEAHCMNPSTANCPFNTKMRCHNSIRWCSIDKSGELHYYGCSKTSEPELTLDYKNDNSPMCTKYPLPHEHVNDKCVSCELFPICNGCRIQRAEYPPEHCEEMLKMKDKFIKYDWVTY